MDEALEKKIEMRKAEAEQKQIRSKAATVATILGKTDSRSEGRNESRISTYEDKELFIEDRYSEVYEHDGGAMGFGTTIRYRGAEVYSCPGGTITSFVPGKWEKLLDDLYEKAIPIDKANRKRIAKERTEQERLAEKQKGAKWGL